MWQNSLGSNRYEHKYTRPTIYTVVKLIYQTRYILFGVSPTCEKGLQRYLLLDRTQILNLCAGMRNMNLIRALKMRGETIRVSFIARSRSLL